MSAIVMIFALLIGSVLQAALPSPWWLGHASFPLLLGLVIYYALLGTVAQTLTCALLAGLFTDALELVPLGYTSFILLLAGFGIRQIRDVMMVRQWSTHALLGGAAHSAGTLACFLLLQQSDRPALSLAGGAMRIAGAMITGAVSAPLVFALLDRLERTLGRPASEGAA